MGRVFALMLACLAMLGFTAGSYGRDGSVIVLMPQVREPYQAIYQTVVDGVASRGKLDVHAYTIPRDYSLDKLRSRLQEDQAIGLIALGGRSLRVANALQSSLPTVFGGTSAAPPELSGVRLVADPERQFRLMHELMPQIRRVHVVYNPQNSGWLIARAEQAAKAQGVDLVSYRAADLKEALRHYQGLVTRLDRDRDALWLPLDRTTVNDKVVLPLILRSAWDRRFAVLSSKPVHASRGILLSFYPDNFAMGRRLADLMSNQLANPKNHQVETLQDLQLAINLRTASHLGLTFNKQQRQLFHLIFPPK